MTTIEKRLSKTLGQIKKGYAYDSPLGVFPTVQVLGKADAGDVDTVVASTELSTTEVTEVTGNDITQPDVPRVLQIKGGEAGTTGIVTIYGKSVTGEAIEENITLNAATAVEGTLVFASVDKVVLPKALAANHHVSVGTLNKLGLARPISSAGNITKLTVDGVDDTVVSAGTSQIEGSWVKPTTTPTGLKEFVVYYNTYLM